MQLFTFRRMYKIFEFGVLKVNILYQDLIEYYIVKLELSLI